ncbi:MAG: hypothetical protein CFH37_00972 [Alphaproteobacteria bacterium MarineAlpha9_Bin7]|nr:MAG: hypothetical protein CFH37_00972 [Alphaproteobacteria bacterium MarineAlpha9_Bin7]
MHWILRLVGVILIAVLTVKSSLGNDDLPIVTIGYLDLIQDVRYEDWGVHPVDIRSATAIVDRRAYAGAQLAIDELKQFTRIAKARFAMQRETVENAASMIATINRLRESGTYFFLMDAPDSVVGEVAAQTRDQDIVLFNTTATGDALRNEHCQQHLFHIAASRSMMADAVAQYLVSRKWTRVLVLRGPLPEDIEMTRAFERSAELFGLNISQIRDFVLGNDPRAREANNLNFLTGSAKYDAVFVADVDGEFSLTVPFATQKPAAVTGASGIVPRVWHWSYLRHGAPQVHGRFERMHGRRMGEADWGAWVALKTIGMAIARAKTTNAVEVAAYLRSDKLRIDGSKGPGMSIRTWNNQLRQPIMLTTENWTITRAPIEGFKHQTNDLDTIGHGERDTNCKF